MKLKYNTLQMWIVDDMQWLLVHGVATEKEVVQKRFDQADRSLSFWDKKREALDHVSRCGCDTCSRRREAWHFFGSAMRDLNRFDSADVTPCLFGLPKMSVPKIEEFMAAYLGALTALTPQST